MAITCPHCGQLVDESRVLCPHCGSAVHVAPKLKGLKAFFKKPISPSKTRPIKTVKPEKPQRERTPKPVPVAPAMPTQAVRTVKVKAPAASAAVEKPPRPSRRKLLMTLLTVFLALVVLVAALAGAAYAGIYQGERDRVARREAVIEEHYTAGINALNDGRFELAAAEFVYVLELDPGNALAEEGRSQARARLDVKPTPTLEVVVDLSAQLLAQAKEAYAAGDWVSTAGTLTQLRALDQGYEQDDVEAMLFESLRNAGRQYIEADNLEVAISYLDQAVALQPLDGDLLYERNQAARYLDALNFWAVDWSLAIENFTALVEIDPYYKDVSNRLYRAYVSYGDFYAEGDEMCPAELQYTQALRLYADAEVEQKRADAAAVCLIATPVPVNGANPAQTAQPITGFSVGRLAYPVYNNAAGSYDIYALYADGRIIRAATNALQPWWEWGTGRVAYSDRTYGGLSMVLPEEGVPLALLSPQGQSAPALSPDGQRIAYAAQDGEGNSRIYVVDILGTGQPQALGIGWMPAWGRNGILAYTGCDTEGCGIVLDNPDDGVPGTRLTGSAQDTAVAWAPGSNLLAYMSNVSGTWDLYLLSPEGGVQIFLNDPAVDEGLPAWAPDGSAIAYVSNRDGKWGVFVKPLGDQMPRRILDLGATLPAWETLRLSWAP